MAVFPRIQSPCPYKANLAAVMDGDFCRMCKRSVVDLTDMDDAGRIAFLQACGETEVCVSYRLPVRAALAAALVVATSAIPVAVAACEPDEASMETIVGGLRQPAKAQLVHVAMNASAAPELPVVYEDKAPTPNDQAKAPTARPAAAKTNS
jgi:hypothetical protein